MTIQKNQRDRLQRVRRHTYAKTDESLSSYTRMHHLGKYSDNYRQHALISPTS